MFLAAVAERNHMILTKQIMLKGLKCMNCINLRQAVGGSQEDLSEDIGIDAFAHVLPFTEVHNFHLLLQFCSLMPSQDDGANEEAGNDRKCRLLRFKYSTRMEDI